MKNKYFFLIMLFMVVGAFSSQAQEARIVKVEGWDPASGEDPVQYENNLYYAIMEDTTARKTNPNVIFELERDHIYFLGKQIENYDFKLHIRGEEGDGLLPEIQGSVKSDGTYGLDYIRSYYSMTLENVAFNGYLPDGSYQHWEVELRGTGSTYKFKNVIFDGDRAASVCVRGDSLKVYVEDCTMGNIGYRTAFGGNGRFIDLRPEAQYLDTLFIKNCTTYNLTDRIIRNMNTKVNYLYIDHLTAVNTVGRHGGIQLGNCMNATVKNSVFANVIMIGHSDDLTSEQTQPENPPKFAVITLDTIYENGSYVIENNNIYWDESVKSVWSQIESVSQPDYVNPLIVDAVDVDKVDEIYFTDPLAFETMCDPHISYIALYHADPNAGTYPDSWCVGGDGGYFPDQIDLSYSKSSESYTAAEGGLPVGNLNYFPDVSTASKAFSSANGGAKVFPNPFDNQVSISYRVVEKGEVKLSIYDMSGRMIKELVNQNQSEGKYTIVWDGTDQTGKIHEGRVMIYRVEAPSYVTSGKLFSIK